MTDFSFKRKPLKFDIYGTIYEVNKPTFGQVELLQEKLDEAKGDNKAGLHVMRDFLETLGLNKTVISELEPDHLNEIIAIISGSKKN